MVTAADRQRLASDLLEFGFPADKVTVAVSRYSDLNECISYLTGEHVDVEDAAVPDLIMPDLDPLVESLPLEEPPHYGPTTIENAAGWGITDFSPPSTPSISTLQTHHIDLTDSRATSPTPSYPPKVPPKPASHRPAPLLLGPPTRDEDADLNQALRESVAGLGSGGGLGIGGGVSVGGAGGGGGNEEEEMNKAMEASMLSVDEEVSSGIDAIPAEMRVRLDERPVVLRALSHHLSGLTSYLQCLYSLPLFRRTILSFQPPPLFPLSPPAPYTNAWSGSTPLLDPLFASAVEAGPGKSDPKVEGTMRILSVQRLFALMEGTERKWVHVQEVVEVLGVRDWEWRLNGEWMDKVKEYHEALVADLVLLTRLRLEGEVENESMSATDLALQIQQLEACFEGKGRQVANNSFISAPLPAEDSQPFTVLQIPIYNPSHPRDTLFDALDRQLIDYNPTTNEESLSLLSVLPRSLVLQFTRAPQVNLDSFGDGALEKEVFGLEEKLWLDRYSVKERVKVGEGRRAVRELEAKIAEVRERRRKICVTKEGKDALELVRTTLQYLVQATSDDPAREARQKRLADQYSIILTRLDAKVSELDAEIASLEKETHAVFNNPDMQKHGPYNLTGLIMRNGLHGRGSAWSVVRGDDGKWWKIVDLEQTETTLEEALSDKAGSFMSAGITMAFYQLEDQSLPEVVVPADLAALVRADNEEFARELSGGIKTSDAFLDEAEQLVDDLQAPIAPTINEEEPSIDPSLIHAVDTAPPPPGDKTSPMLVSEPASRHGSPMRVDVVENAAEDEASKASSDSDDWTQEDTLRLRGGAGDDEDATMVDEEEEGEEYDDEGLDEDEVELGTLVPMGEEWDIDRAVGKVGGLPRWLDPFSPLSHEEAKCAQCGAALSLLMQLNSPDDERPHAAARTLYVFACRKAACRSSGKDLKVLRVQTPSPNAFYPPTPQNVALRKSLELKLDSASNLADAAPAGSSPAKPFAEWDITCEPEPYEESYLPEPSELRGDGEGNSAEDAAEPDSKTGVDREFLRFQERISRLPEQVLRQVLIVPFLSAFDVVIDPHPTFLSFHSFYRLPDVEEPEPLWVSATKIAPTDVPACALCGGERKVEFQILSTLLSFLGDDDFNFDSFLIYTCVKNCEIPSLPALPGFGDQGTRSGWAEEWVGEQTFASDGVKFGVAQ